MTRGLAHTPAGHAQYSHLFETPERPRASFLALRWTGMSKRSGPFPRALGSCSQHLWPRFLHLLTAVSVLSEVLHCFFPPGILSRSSPVLQIGEYCGQ